MMKKKLNLLFFLRTGIFLLALNLSAGNIPGLMPQISRMSGVLTLIIFILTYRPLPVGQSFKTGLSFIALPFSILLLVFESTFLIGIASCLFALQILHRDKEGGKGSDLPVFMFTTLFYTIIYLLDAFTPYLWHLFQSASLGFSIVATSMVGSRMTLGASAVGIKMTVSAFCFCAGLWAAAPARTRRILSSAILLMGANTLYLWLQPLLFKWIHQVDQKLNPSPLYLQPVLIFLLWIALYPAAQNASIPDIPFGIGFKARRRAVWVAALLLASGLIFTFQWKGHHQPGDILFSTRSSNWSVPVYGKTFGQSSMGMFGILPNFLETRGYRVKLWDQALTEDVLNTVGALVVFNPDKPFSGPEKDAIHAFVKAGGSLLVAGDHTDVLGSMRVSNDLLQPFNIALNFDTALPDRTGWCHGLVMRRHPITLDLEEDYETSIWVGASLSIHWPARPIIIGKLGWADKGDYSNTKRAFLGDYKRAPDEQVGDLVLAAESGYGKGKVLVFGDTSSFQNGSLSVSHLFIDRVFAWLTSSGGRHYSILRSVVGTLLLAVAVYLLVGKPSTVLILSCILTLHAVIGIVTFAGMPGDREPPVSPQPKAPAYETAYIDLSHVGRFSVYGPSDYSTWGISINLMRNRYLPLFLKRFSGKTLAGSRLFIVIAPTVPFTAEEILILKRFMESGGTIIWSVGWEEMEASRSFLSTFHLSIDSVPLGPAVIDTQLGSVRFLEAWPVLGDTEPIQVIIRKNQYPLIVYQKVGKGGLLLIADSEFLFSRNIESYRDYFNIDNIRFFKFLLDKLNTDKNG